MSPNVSTRLLAVQPDGRLADLASRGDERAFEAIVRRYRAPMMRYCARMGLGEAVAEDVVQHALLKAWLALIGGTTVRELRPWLYRIVHNMAISSIRVTREQPGELPETAEDGVLHSTRAGAEECLAAREALGLVAALPAMQRHAIVLTAVQGRSHGEAASVMGISDGAVRGLIHRARRSLRSAAAAFMPPGLQGWLGRGSEAAPMAEGSGGVTAGAGALGLTGVLAKGTLVAATAGLVIAGGGVLRPAHHAGTHRPPPAAPGHPAAYERPPAASLPIGSSSLAPGAAGARRTVPVAFRLRPASSRLGRLPVGVTVQGRRPLRDSAGSTVAGLSIQAGEAPYPSTGRQATGLRSDASPAGPPSGAERIAAPRTDGEGSGGTYSSRDAQGGGEAEAPGAGEGNVQAGRYTGSQDSGGEPAGESRSYSSSGTGSNPTSETTGDGLRRGSTSNGEGS